MNWMWVLEHLLTIYVAFGAYCGAVWSHKAGGWSWPAALTAGAVIGVFIWPFAIETADDFPNPRPGIKSAQSKTARTERKRMAKELAQERGAVEMLEMSVEHRREMAALHERRRKAEELV